jgi:carboxylesterase
MQSPFVWFKDALDGYDYLVEQGYDEIVVAGLSLGGDYNTLYISI